MYAQVIDDTSGRTLASIGSFGKTGNANVESCNTLGKALAEKCKAVNVSELVFDRNGYRYHGRIKAFAEGAREAGLSF